MSFEPLHTFKNDNSGVNESHTGFQRLPLELRNEIYQYVIGDIRQLDISASTWLGTLHRDGPRRLLLRHIPRCLILNRQILDEVILIAPDQISGIKACRPRDTSRIFPPDKLLPNVRRLEFTLAQPISTSNERSACSSAQDVASRCPRLEELTILLPATKGTMDNFAPYLINIFENKKLVKLTLGYNRAPMRRWHADYSLLRPLESWFLRECEERGRNVDFTIDLSPGQVPACYEERRVRKGCIEYLEGFDMFG